MWKRPTQSRAEPKYETTNLRPDARSGSAPRMGSVCRSRATPYTPLPVCRTHQGLKAPPWSWTAEGHTVRREASDPARLRRYRFCIRDFCLKPVPRRSRNRTTPAPVRQEPRRAVNGTSPAFRGPRSFPLRRPAHPPLPQWRIPPFQGRRGPRV